MLKLSASMGLLVVVVVSTGCAAIFQGTSDTIMVGVQANLPRELNPSDVQITVGGMRIPSTGGVVTVKRQSASLPIRATCLKPGYLVTVSPNAVNSSFSAGYLILDILFTGWLGLVIDLATGAYYNYPDTVMLTLNVQKIGRE